MPTAASKEDSLIMAVEINGFRRLQSYEQLDCYYEWERTRRKEITALLREAYIEFCEHPKSIVNDCCNFGGLVGIPLFILTVLWITSTSSNNHWFIAITMLGFGFLLRYYQNHIIDLTSRQYFASKQKDLLYAYIERNLEDSLASSTSTEESLDIYAFYEYCRKRILWEEFRYYEKPKKSKRTNYGNTHPK